MKGKLVAIALLTLSSLLFSGCYGSAETDEIAYILIIGVDKGENGKQKVTCQVAIPSGKTSTGSSNSEQDKNKFWFFNTINTPSPAEENLLLTTTQSRRPNLTHVNVIIFSEEIAKQGLEPQLATLFRSRDYRDTIFLIVVPGTAEEYMKKNTPRFDTNITRFYEVFLSKGSASGYFIPSTIHDFYTALKNQGCSATATYSAINPMNLTDKPTGTKTPEQKGSPYLAGNIPRTGSSSTVDFLGLAVFHDDKMVGVLNSVETRAVAILQHKFDRSFVGIVDPLKPEKEVVNVNVRYESATIKAALSNGIPVFDIVVKLDCDILGITSGINYEAPEYRELLEAQIVNLFTNQIITMIHHTQALGTDPVGFGLYLRSKFSNSEEMAKANFNNLYQIANFNVTVEAKIRRTGLIWRTSPIKN